MGKRKIKAPPVLRFCAPYQRFARKVWQSYKEEEKYKSEILNEAIALRAKDEARWEKDAAEREKDAAEREKNAARAIALFHFCDEKDTRSEELKKSDDADGIEVIPEPCNEGPEVKKNVAQGVLLGKMTKLISKKWSELSEEQKQPFQDEARSEKEAYLQVLSNILKNNNVIPPAARATTDLTIKLLFNEIYTLYRIRRDIFGSTPIEKILHEKCEESFQYEHEVMRVNQLDSMKRATDFMNQHPRFLQNMHFPNLRIPGLIPKHENFAEPMVKQEMLSPCQHTSPDPNPGPTPEPSPTQQSLSGQNNENIPYHGSPVQGPTQLPISPPLTPKVVKLPGYEPYKPLSLMNTYMYPRIPQFIHPQFLSRFTLLPPAYFGPHIRASSPVFNTLYNPVLLNNGQAPKISISCPLPPVYAQHFATQPCSSSSTQPIPFPSTNQPQNIPFPTPDTVRDSDESEESDADDVNITMLSNGNHDNSILGNNNQYNISDRYDILQDKSGSFSDTSSTSTEFNLEMPADVKSQEGPVLENPGHATNDIQGSDFMGFNGQDTLPAFPSYITLDQANNKLHQL